MDPDIPPSEMTNYSEPGATHARMKCRQGGVSIYWRDGDIMLQSDIQIIHMTPEEVEKLIELLYFAAQESYKERKPHAPTQHP